MLCGVDVAAPEEQRAGAKKRPFSEQLDLMKGQLSPSEWSVIQSCRGDERRMEDAFRKFWSLKEVRHTSDRRTLASLASPLLLPLSCSSRLTPLF